MLGETNPGEKALGLYIVWEKVEKDSEITEKTG
jgi:hypothetical protein